LSFKLTKIFKKEDIMENIDMENVIIAGLGPAGLTAAIYTARSGRNPLELGGFVSGGQLIVSPKVENYPDFPEQVSDMELMDRFRKQTEQFGGRFKTAAFKELVETDKNGFVQVEAGSTRTSTQDVFGCGDVCNPVYKQAVVAAGQGYMTAMDVEQYIYSKEEVRC
jgi:thioredoxin reductase